jgi:uncharacterized protein
MIPEWLIYLLAGVAGGAVNASAGGAKLFVFPLLLASGLSPLAANVTAAVALWPAQLPAVWVWRKTLLARTPGASHGRRSRRSPAGFSARSS